MRYIDDDLREDLEGVIDVLLPLQEWVDDRNKIFVPRGALPWRNGKTKLNARSLQIVPIIDGLIASSSTDVDLFRRFERISNNPLSQSPLDDVVAWRAARGFDAEPAFGIVESQNVLTDATGQPASRVALYARYLPLFRTAAEARRKAPPPGITWKDFTDVLYNDKPTPPLWPDPSAACASSFFMKFLLKDALYAVLEMRGPLPEPWNRAVALELGEYRHPGNAFTPDDAKNAVIAFRKAMKASDKAAPAASAAIGPPPVGSPPATTKPEHLEGGTRGKG